MSYYEQDSTRAEYLAFHYPGSDPLEPLLGSRTPPLAERYPFAVRTLWQPRPDALALDVGAACGRVVFDLARDHRFAVGIDLARALILAAQRVKHTGRARYRTVVEGRLTQEHDVAVETAGNAAFLIGDALALPFAGARFATVVALNLVDRVPDPGQALAELARMVAPGGTLLVGSPYTWLEEFTPFESWLGGRDDVRGFDTVRETLAPAFVLEEEARMPFFIPQHARLGQLGQAHIQRFRRTT